MSNRNRGPKIKCKPCGKTLSRLDWMQNTECTNPQCRCPAVKQAREMMNQVIEDAKESSRSNKVEVTWSEPDRGIDDTVDQYYIDCPDVMTILVTPSRRK